MKKILFSGLLVALILAACSAAGPASVQGEWKLVSYGPASAQAPAVADVETSIEFDAEGNMGGNVGCNGFGGEYSVEGDALQLGPVMSTMMFCEGPVGEQEMATLAVLQDSVTFALDGDTLTLTSADGTSMLVLARK